jgi:ADP-heptose:LPS heptosyltransferase
LPLFLAVLNQADLVISGDTGPLHLASALGKKVIGLFAVEDGVKHYAPIYKKNEIILGNTCTCNGDLNHYAVCKSRNPCMNSISPEQVFELIKKRYLP